MTEISNAPLKACNQPNLVARTGHRVLCVNWAVGKRVVCVFKYLQILVYESDATFGTCTRERCL